MATSTGWPTFTERTTVSGTPTMIFTVSVLASANAGTPRSDERTEFDGFLHDVAIKGRNQRGVAQSDFRLARQGPSGLQLLLAGIVLRASRIEVGLRDALSVIQDA